MNTIMDFFSNNPMFLYALIIFFICVIIGFFGDRYFKNKEITEKYIKDNEKTNDSYETPKDVDIKSNKAKIQNMSTPNKSVDENIKNIDNNLNENLVSSSIEEEINNMF